MEGALSAKIKLELERGYVKVNDNYESSVKGIYAAGDIIAKALRAEGVDISHLRRIDGPTAYCIIGHRNAERIFLSFDLGISMLEPGDDPAADRAAIAKAPSDREPARRRVGLLAE